jgi:hypothetical protein
MLTRSRLAAAAFALTFAVAVLPAAAEEPATEKPVCGRDLMTSEELTAHREKMRSLATREERAAYRAEHHAKMLERAKERGVELPAEGCPRGRGMGGPGGAGRGPGPGPGPGPKQP